MLEAIKVYNNQYHSTIKTNPQSVENNECDKEKIYQNILNAQKYRLEKHNKKRENYEEKRKVGFIRNYRANRHKDQPKYRKYKLENVHLTNIKRPLKFTENNDDNSDDNRNDNTDNGSSSTSGGEF